MNNLYYYECHVTIEPVFDERLEQVKAIAKLHDFRVADLLMKKRAKDTAERSKEDTFITGRSTIFNSLKSKMTNLIHDLKINNINIYRYKIEDILVDSKIKDEYNIL